MAKLVLTATQDCILSLGATTDKKGNPAPIDESTPPVWSSTNTDLLTVAPSGDGKTATVSAVGPIGTAQAQVSVDLQVGDGVVPGIGVLDVEITAGLAATVNIVPGTPTEQP